MQPTPLSCCEVKCRSGLKLKAPWTKPAVTSGGSSCPNCARDVTKPERLYELKTT